MYQQVKFHKRLNKVCQWVRWVQNRNWIAVGEYCIYMHTVLQCSTDAGQAQAEPVRTVTR